MNKTILITIIVLAIIIVVIGFIIMNYPMTNSNPALSPNPAPVQNPITSKTTRNIAIKDYSFSPASLSIKAGDTIIWTNEGAIIHTVTSDSGNELDSPTLSNGRTYSHTFTNTGTYNYYCSLHPMMKGTIVAS